MGLWPGVLICFLGALIYSNSLQGEFFCDDHLYIVDSESIRDIRDIRGIWRAYNTRFLVGMSFALNYWLGRMDVFGYHVFNTLVHICAALLVRYFVFLTLQTPVMRVASRQDHADDLPFFAALVFLCHPIQTEGVSYIMQRAVAMAAVSYLGTLIFYIRGRLSGRFIFYVLSWLSMAAGFLIKEMTVTVIVSLVFYEMCFFGRDERGSRKMALRLLPFLCGIIVMFVIMRNVATDAVTQVQYAISPHFFDWRYVFTEINVLRTYLRLLVLPLNQTFLYDYPIAEGFFQASTLASLAVLAALLFMAVHLYKSRDNRILSFAIVWFFITTSVEATAVILGARNVIYEHWLYLPMVGYAVFLPFFLRRFFVDRAAFKRVMTGVIVFLCMLTYQRNFIWRTELRLWEDIVQKSPNNAGSHFGMAEVYQRNKIYDRAYAHYQQALFSYKDKKRTPERYDRAYISSIYNNLALICYIFKRDEEMAGYFHRAVSVNPRNEMAYRNAGAIYYELHCYQEALAALREALRLNPRHPESYYYQGLSYAASEDLVLAKSSLRQALILYEKAKDRQKIQDVQQAISALADLRGQPAACSLIKKDH
jgi:tetratricopeptide (TPR) repeat protein